MKTYVIMRKDVAEFLATAGSEKTLDVTPDQRVQCVLSALYMVARERGVSKAALEIVQHAHAELSAMNDRLVK